MTIDVNATVTDAVVDQYWERGYWISPQLFSDEHLRHLCEAHQRFWANDRDRSIPSQYGLKSYEPDTPQVRQVCNGFWVNDEFCAAVTSPILGEIGARLMKVDSVRLWHDQVLYKPGIGPDGTSEAGNIGWHQDYAFW